jgi:hypothetical protein
VRERAVARHLAIKLIRVARLSGYEVRARLIARAWVVTNPSIVLILLGVPAVFAEARAHRLLAGLTSW